MRNFSKKEKTEKYIELEITSIGFEGISIARKEEQVYFVKNGLPGDKVVAKINKYFKNYTQASISEIISPSKNRVEPICKYFGSCGGCSWQCLKYEEQLVWKKKHIIDAHLRLGKVVAENYHDTLPAKQTLHYRNKMDFSFSSARWLTTEDINSGKDFNTRFALGLHIPGRFDKVLDIEECNIQKAEWNSILEVIRKKTIELKIPAYNTFKGIGCLKGLCIRHSILNDESLIILITNHISSENEKEFINWYRYEFPKLFPSIVSVTHAINPTNSVNNGNIQFIEGKKFLSESILGINYQISPFSFFQTNSYQLDDFIQLILNCAKIEKEQIIWDLYCGTGSITLPASKLCKYIYGIEIVESAVNDAIINTNNNGITNATFLTADLHKKEIPELLNSLPHPHTIIIDPPRNGLHPNIIQHILQINPMRLIYVSCNPTTQARDLAEFNKNYLLKDVYPVDMFPHTYHIENVAVLELKK
jgi:23S rRNA (uracil1939-C5)-methyltransferase